MKVGITCNIQYSIFGSSRGQNAFWLGQVCKELGYDVCLINQSERGWWEDAEGLEGEFPVVHFKDASGLDLLIDIDGVVSPQLRRAGAKRTVVLLRGSIAFKELEQCSYIDERFYRNLEGVSAVWVWDALNSEEDIRSFRTMFPCPVKRVPFVWTPVFLKNYMRLVGGEGGVWKNNPVRYKLHVFEKNVDNTSSAIIPLSIIKQTEHEGFDSVMKEYVLHNYDSILNKPYFEENTVNPLFIDGKIIRGGRERIIDLLYEGEGEEGGIAPIVITHCRFTPFRYSMLELAWLGIPFIHNSKFLIHLDECNFGGVYYRDNSIDDAMYSLRECISNTGTYTSSLYGRQRIMEEMWSPSSRGDEWRKVFEDNNMREIRVHFYGMWDGFNMEDNFFIREMRRAYPRVSVTDDSMKADLIIFSQFGGDGWKVCGREGVGKVFYSGECPYNEFEEFSDADLMLTHMPDNKEMNNIRMPIWLQYLDFEHNDIYYRNGLNPNGIPMRYACQKHSRGVAERGAFCSYIVSNPQNLVRNRAFQLASLYKKIDSAGQLYNNMNGVVDKMYAGGGAGDVQKHVFLENYKFNICYENDMHKGYVTEKLLQAKMAGCIPIYWGDESAMDDFDPRGFVYMKEPEKIADILKMLDENPDKAEEIASTPAFDNSRIKRVCELRDRIGSELISLAINGVKRAVKPVVVKEDTVASISASTIPDPVFVSYANMKYLQYVAINIETIGRHRGVLKDIRYIVYLDEDISAGDENKLMERFSWIETRRLRKAAVDGFPDFWDIGNFGWKLAILQELSCEEGMADSLIVYTDSGAQWIRLPEELLKRGYNEGICLVEDTEQKNKFWCSPEMVSEMGVTEDELNEYQLMAGFVVFRGMNDRAMVFFKEALEWGKKRNVLCGAFVRGVLENGQNVGHRHDQSIMSILSMRHRIGRVNGNSLVCMSTLRKAFLEGSSIYLHRGDYITHRQDIDGIDDVWVISLDRRMDRWEQWCRENPELSLLANRFSAIDGKQIEMNNDIYSLFSRNDFMWKKSVTGCALSHIMLWAQLACEKPPVGTYLILEDDMRFADSEWRNEFNSAMKCVPADAELLYLGGVLPKNKGLYKECVAPVNEYWGVIKPNPYFNKEGHMLPMFHFCAYSYILTKAGARKLLNALNSTEGCFTSIDHFLALFPKRYVLRNLMTKCFQEEEEIYVNAEFDNFKRVDNYDSDIWNNIDKWNMNELFNVKYNKRSIWYVLDSLVQKHPIREISKGLLNRNSYLEYLYRTGQKEELNSILIEDVCVKQKTVGEENVSKISDNIVVRPTRDETCLETVDSTSQKIIYYYSHDNNDMDLIETKWLREIIGSGAVFKQLESQHKIVDGVPIFLISKPYISIWKKICKKYNDIGREFYIIHLSDEACKDDIELYQYEHCKGVIRNYVRDDISTGNVLTIPLGYMRNCSNMDNSGFTTNGLAFDKRDMAWMFHGTGWFGRGEVLNMLMKEFEKYDCKIMKQWLDDNMTSEDMYKGSLSNTKFCPILRGNNIETYRLYEAIEAGCIPIYVRVEGDNLLWKMIHDNLGLIELGTWSDAVECMKELMEYPAEAERYRNGIWSRWMKWKQEIIKHIGNMI